MTITLEDLKKMFESKEKELNKREFDLFVNKFWDSQQDKAKAKIEHNKNRLSYLKERKKIMRTHLELLKIEINSITAKEKQYKEESKELRDYLKK